jgi:excisionase family DNA binding protein
VPDRLTYTVCETAEAIGLSVSVTYRMIRDGSLPAIRVGRRWVVPRRPLEEWLADWREESRCA